MTDLGDYDITPTPPPRPPSYDELPWYARAGIWLGICYDPRDWTDGEPWPGLLPPVGSAALIVFSALGFEIVYVLARYLWRVLS